jgi:ribosomal protein S6--L-glutamate ligase
MQMKAALISLGSVSSTWTLEAMRAVFDTVDDLDLRKLEIYVGSKRDTQVLYQEKPLPNYDCIYCKGSFHYASILRAVTSCVPPETYLPITDRAYTLVHNKLLTHLILQQANIPMPLTYLTPTTASAKRLLAKLTYPIVMKFPEGTQGKGVMFAESFSSASALLDALQSLKQPFIIQQYIETGGTDIRAIVVGKNVVAAMQRIAVQGERRANIHAGGTGKPVVLDDATKALAIRAAQSVGAEICGVDILMGPKGPLVIELNVSPGLQGIRKATGLNVAEPIAQFLAQRTKEYKQAMSGAFLQELDAPKKAHEIVTGAHFRGARLLLPEIITSLARIKEDDELLIRLEGKKIIIEKHT